MHQFCAFGCLFAPTMRIDVKKFKKTHHEGTNDCIHTSRSCLRGEYPAGVGRAARARGLLIKSTKRISHEKHEKLLFSCLSCFSWALLSFMDQRGVGARGTPYV